MANNSEIITQVRLNPTLNFFSQLVCRLNYEWSNKVKTILKQDESVILVS